MGMFEGRENAAKRITKLEADLVDGLVAQTRAESEIKVLRAGLLLIFKLCKAEPSPQVLDNIRMVVVKALGDAPEEGVTPDE